MKYLISLSIILSLMSTNSYALGDREKGALAGIVGTLVLTEIISDKERETYPNGYPYLENNQRTFYCHKDEITCAYERGVWERERREFEEAKRRAYECGRTGNCFNP
jgi:hypothetical protein